MVSENWSAFQFKRGESGKRQFVITGVANALAAASALLAEKGVAAAASHTLDASLLAKQPDIKTPKGPNIYIADVDYVPRGQLGPGGGGDDPTSRPTRWTRKSAPREESTDLDAEDRPIVNAAGQPFQVDFPRPFNGSIFYGRRWEVLYDFAKAVDFENTVNQDTVFIPKFGKFGPGRLMLLTYEPDVELIAGNNDPVPVTYTIEFRKGFKQDPDGLWDGFKYRIRNDGYMGWYGDEETEENPATRGNFVTSKGQRVTEPQLMDKFGKPLDDTIKVESSAEQGEAPTPVPSDWQLPDEVIEETPSGVVFLKYTRCKKMPFSGLGLVT